MAQKPKPVTRHDAEQLLENSVTGGADAYTARCYLRRRNEVPALQEVETKGKHVPGIDAGLFDLYSALWNPQEPELKQEVRADQKYWAALIDQTLQSTAFAELHGFTKLRELPSIIGTVSMGESIVAMVPKKDKQKLQQIAEAQNRADRLKQQAQSVQQSAHHAQALADATKQQVSGQGEQTQGQANGDGQGESGGQSNGSPGNQDQAGDGQGQPGQGQPTQSSGQSQSGQPGGRGQLTSKEAQDLANELAKQAAEAKAQADQLEQDASQAQAEANSLADELMGKPGSKAAEDKLRDLKRLGQQAATNAQAKVEEISETIECWGLDEGELTKKDPQEAIKLLERMKRNADFKKFAALLGRIRKIAARKAKSKIQGEGQKVAKVEHGRDIRRAHRSEIIALVVPALRYQAVKRWAGGTLRLVGQKTKHALGHGPVICCTDASPSMNGPKDQFAKATTLSLAHYAKLQRRSFGWNLFETRVKISRVYPEGKISAEQMLEMVEVGTSGGTNFEEPLQKAMDMITNEGLKKADIVFITDGDCAVSDKFLSKFNAFKKQYEVTVVVVLCDVGHTSDTTVKKFADVIERASKFTADEAETKVFAHL